MPSNILRQLAVVSVVSITAMTAVPSFANEPEINFPKYVTTEDQKIDFTAKCVAVFEKAENDAIDESNEIYAQKRQTLWANHLETLVPNKKARKKRIKKQRKALKYAASRQNSSGLLGELYNMKAQTQCQFPSADLRSVG